MLKTISILTVVLSSLVITYAWQFFRSIMKYHTAHYRYVQGVYDIPHGCYIFHDDFGTVHKIPMERDMDEREKELYEKIQVYICYSFMNPDDMYECEADTELMEKKKIRHYRNMTYLVSFVILTIGTILFLFT